MTGPMGDECPCRDCNTDAIALTSAEVFALGTVELALIITGGTIATRETIRLADVELQRRAAHLRFPTGPIGEEANA